MINKFPHSKEFINGISCLAMLIASKYDEEITKQTLKKDYPNLYFEMRRLGDIDLYIPYINIEIIYNKRKNK